MKITRSFFILALICCSFTAFAKKSHHKNVNHEDPYSYLLDATEEINRLDPKAMNQEDDDEDDVGAAVFGIFVTMLQSFFSIVQNPHDTATVGTNLAQMANGAIHAGMEIFKNLPEDVTLEERQEFITQIEDALKNGIRSIHLAKKALLRKSRNLTLETRP